MTDFLEIISEVERQFLANVLIAYPDVTEDDIELIGLIRTFWDQHDGSYGLMTVDSINAKRVCLQTDAYDLQIAHTLVGYTPTQQVSYGSRINTEGELRLTLIGAGVLPKAAALMTASFQQTSYLRIDSISFDTPQILTNNWRFDLTKQPGVDPMLTAFAISYVVRGLGVSDFLINL